MSEINSTVWETPSIEVRVYRDNDLVERELCETEVEAAAVTEAWSDVEGVVCRVDDLSGGSEPAGVLDPRPWEVDADDAFSFEAPTLDNDEER
jgi:hypothetical protein